jgi:hypothetical protein
MASDDTIVDVLEDVLQVPFEPRYISNLASPIAKRLADRVGEFYRAFKIPEKKENQLRPYLSPRFTTTYGLGIDYYTKPAFFKDGNFEFNPAEIQELAPQIKTYLLYCDSVCIYDALPPMLDYFRFGDSSGISQRRLPALTHLLKQYAGVAPLLRNRILIPICDEVFGERRDTPFVDDVEKVEIVAALVHDDKSLPADEAIGIARVLGSIVKEQWWQKEYLQGRVDLYFPHRQYSQVLLGILRSLERRFSSATIVEPFNVGLLGSLSSISPSKLALSDIVNVRREDAFSDFRVFLHGVFDRLNRSEQYFSDFDTEFARAVREEMAEKRIEISALARKSNLLREAFSQIDRISIGAVSGAVAGGFGMGSPEAALLAALAGGAMSPLYDVLRGILDRSQTRHIRLSLRNHFLTIGIPAEMLDK